VFPSYDTEHLLMCLLRKFNINTSEVKIIHYPTLVQFQNGEVEVFGAYVINEPVWAKLRGIDVDVLPPSDFGVEFYSDTIITTKKYYSSNQDILKRFLRAASRGWSFAEKNPDEAVNLMYEVVRGSIGEGEPKEHQIGMSRKAVEYLRAGPDNLNFYMEKSRWDEMETLLYDIGRLKSKGHVANLCDFTMVERALK